LLTARHGTPGLFPVVVRPVGLALDLGFKVFRPLSAAEVRAGKLSAGDIVRLEPSTPPGADDLTITKVPGATKADLFTYRAHEVRVIDGDTLAVTLRPTPQHEIDKKLRLRGLNCPEMDTAAGRAAKQFVLPLIAAAESILLTTTKPDKYDRYLADVFVTRLRVEDASARQATQQGTEEIFLNNALLESGHAERMNPAETVELL
jgi:endonuclease YncB( thermonuclease family)